MTQSQRGSEATVHGAVLRKANEPLTIEEVELTPPGPGRVRVRIAASGVCHSDLSLLDGSMPQPMPAVLGHEGAGIVTEIGAGVSSPTVGDHVILSWIAPCRACGACLRGQPTLCEHGMDHAFAGPYGTVGGDPVMAALGTATFAEETVVPATAAIPIPADFPLTLASLVGCGVVTGVGAIVNTASVRPGETVAIVGCGGVGLAAVQGARLSGASRVVAVDRVPAKLEMAVENGATDVVDASRDDPVAAVRDLVPAGTDHAVEVVGTSATILQAYGMARRGGAVTIVGAGRFDDQVTFPVLGLMVDSKRVQGSVYGATDPLRDFPRMLALHRAGRLDLDRLVTRRIALEQVNDAFRAMTAGEVARSVIVFD
jgi:S-(hydroxymethyl)glutathione dehydrogenase/alcohol dehydrogenase